MASKTLKIYNGNTAIEMPKIKYSITAEEESEESIMMSGKIVKDILGYRTVISAEWDWVPAGTLAAIVKLIRDGKFRDVEYQDVDGTTKKEKFKISQPEPEIFKFGTDGVARWRSVKIKMTAQEVTNDD